MFLRCLIQAFFVLAYLEDDSRLPQTFKVIFAGPWFSLFCGLSTSILKIGCHDNGYVVNLRSLITAGFKEKLILLKTYAEMATGIHELDLPTMDVPGLFMGHKIGPVSHGSTYTPSSSSGIELPPSPDTDSPFMPNDFGASSNPLSTPTGQRIHHKPAPPSYASTFSWKTPSVSSQTSTEVPNPRLRKIDPNILKFSVCS